MDLQQEIYTIGRIVSELREKNKQLTDINKAHLEKQTKTIRKLKDIIESIDNLLSTQGKSLKK